MDRKGLEFSTSFDPSYLGSSPSRNLSSTKIDTKGFEALLNLVKNTSSDSFELYYGLFLYNQVSDLQ